MMDSDEKTRLTPDSTRPRWVVVTPHFPSVAEPYRGAPVWATLKGLAGLVNLRVFCSLPRYPFSYSPPGYLYSRPQTGITAGLFESEALSYWTLPVIGRPLNGNSIYRALRARMQGSAPDLLLAYWAYPDGYAAVRLAAELGIPAVISPRGSDLRIISRSHFLRSQFRYAMTHASAVLPVSRDLGRIACELGAFPDRVHTIHNGVDTSVFSYCDRIEARHNIRIENTCKAVIYVGRLVGMKGLLPLVEAISMLRHHQPEVNWKLFLIGKGPVAENLKSRAAELGIADAVTLLGAREPRDIAAWLNAADLFCLPSASEGCPNVVLEALSCGTPVVATAVGGTPEVVPEGCGLLIADNRPSSIFDGLVRASARPWDRTQIAARSARSWLRVARETYKLGAQAGPAGCF